MAMLQPWGICLLNCPRSAMTPPERVDPGGQTSLQQRGARRPTRKQFQRLEPMNSIRSNPQTKTPQTPIPFNQTNENAYNIATNQNQMKQHICNKSQETSRQAKPCQPGWGHRRPHAAGQAPPAPRLPQIGPAAIPFHTAMSHENPLGSTETGPKNPTFLSLGLVWSTTRSGFGKGCEGGCCWGYHLDVIQEHGEQECQSGVAKGALMNRFQLAPSLNLFVRVHLGSPKTGVGVPGSLELPLFKQPNMAPNNA